MSLGQAQGWSASRVRSSRVAHSRGVLPAPPTPIFQMLSGCQSKHLPSIYHVWALLYTTIFVREGPQMRTLAFSTLVSNKHTS